MHNDTGKWWRTSLEWLVLSAAFLWMVGCAGFPQSRGKDPFLGGAKGDAFKCGEKIPSSPIR